MAQGLVRYVFMSYSRSDERVMQRVSTCLRDEGIDVWVDNEKLDPGNPNWAAEIEKAIVGAGATVVLLSPEAKNSEWVQRELSYTELRKKRIFPVMVRGDADSSVPLRLITSQYVDLQNNESAGLNRLCTALHSYLEAAESNAQEASDEAGSQDIAQGASHMRLHDLEPIEAEEKEAREQAVREQKEPAMPDPIASEDKKITRILNYLAVIGGVTTILINTLSLILDEKPAKQISFGLAVLIPVTLLWRTRRSPRPEGGGPQKSETAAADLLLEGYLRLFKHDNSTRIVYRRIGWIETNASEGLLKEEESRQLIGLSRRAYFWVYGSNIFAVIMLLITLYLYVTTNYAFNPGALLFGRNQIEKENPFIEMTKGDGTILFGSDSPDLSSGEQPRNDAMPIDDFSIQRTEVTNRQYRICRRAGVCKFDPAPITGAPRYYEDPTYDKYPIVGINAFEARQFCAWLGGDLPTLAEWERAARGMNGRAWPWKGNGLTPEHANLYYSGSEQMLEADALPASANPEGVLNLVGNVGEWTRTQLVSNDGGESYLPEDWNGSDKETVLAVRGGSWGFQMSRVTELQISIPETMDEFTGFRCVKAKR